MLDGSLIRIGDDVSTLTAYPYIPYLCDGHSDTCYLVVGTRDGVDHTLSPEDRRYEIVHGGESRFDFSEDQNLFAESFQTRSSK